MDIAAEITYQVEFTEIPSDEEATTEGIAAFRGAISVIDAQGHATVAGRIDVRIMDTAEGSWSIFDILECEMGLAEHLAVSRRTSCDMAVEKLMQIDADFDKGSFLMVDRLEVLPAYRGWNLGIHAINEAIEQLGEDCRWTLLMPFPLSAETTEAGSEAAHVPPTGLQLDLFAPQGADTWLEQLKLQDFTADIKSAVCALKRYYARGGMISLPGTSLMVKHLAAEAETLEVSADSELDEGHFVELHYSADVDEPAAESLEDTAEVLGLSHRRDAA